MGQKINPIGLRLGINKTWDSRWFSGADYATKLHEDLKIRKHVKKALNQAGVSKVVIERTGKKMLRKHPLGASRYHYRQKRRRYR